ncbi:ABC transporter ATP-binding protein [Saccharopolyspora sp. WRP15-2]|uniref:ABC transporter ATP-binding protein n=1 Tax=Saccharopolyspora oryzae TaxID=2997343 RepID=A0ABT4VB09_9PSEU|nr:ABC transporter ATP-binding protein [Saccharopolyspora oryzae]MDA3631146.1 ABC transporter ATP-binding protein [Saccharopolyspora oryzae]
MVRELVGVAKSYRARPVLRGVDLSVTAGEVVGIAGTNGSGKSTLLRILAGLSRPSGGTTSGKPRTGYVPDRFPARQRMSALSYLSRLGRISGLSKADSRRRAGEWLERFALTGGPDTPLRDLSKGNAQKVGLAQALLCGPELLVLDEPWSGLDAGTRSVLNDVIDELALDGTAVVFTDHRPDFARGESVRSHLLVDGRLQPLDAEAATCRILLRGGEDADWAGRRGVLSVRHGDDLELEVAVAERESVLFEAVQRCCAVIAVDSEVGSR